MRAPPPHASPLHDAQTNATLPHASSPRRLSDLFRRLLTPLAPFYRFAIARRNRAFDRGSGVITLDRPVISVGNLSTGGTGKTPCTMWLLRTLRDAGFTPAVAMRGYGRPPHVGIDSDEAREYRAAFPELPLVAQPNRVQGLLELFATPQGDSITAIILDDGFQHRQIARQLDIVLMDATRSAFHDALLPAGNLREPVDSLARAHIVLLTHADQVPASQLRELAARVRAINPALLVCDATHAWDALHTGADASALPVASLAGVPYIALCAIGNPRSFITHATAQLGAPLDAITLPDHDPYAAPTLERILTRVRASRAEAVLTTHKDWSKLARVKPDAWRNARNRPVLLYRPALSLRIITNNDALQERVLAAAQRTIE